MSLYFIGYTTDFCTMNLIILLIWYFRNKFSFQFSQEIEEAPAEPSTEKMVCRTDTTEEVSLTEFLKSVFAILPISDFIHLKLSTRNISKFR